MNNDFEKLLDNSFAMKKISLDIVDSQNQKSLAARGDNNSTTENENNFKTPETFDIRLHESLRVMSDWVHILENQNLSHKKKSAQKI